MASRVGLEIVLLTQKLAAVAVVRLRLERMGLQLLVVAAATVGLEYQAASQDHQSPTAAVEAAVARHRRAAARAPLVVVEALVTIKDLRLERRTVAAVEALVVMGKQGPPVALA